MEKIRKIKYFLDQLHQDEIKNQVFYLFGYEKGYEKVLSYNYGYLPFCMVDDLKITEHIVPSKNTTIRSNIKRKSTNYIVIHNTGMAHPTATAKGLDEYIHTTTREASWHFSVDDKEAFQQIPIDEVGWHAGDGRNIYPEVWLNDKGFHLGGGNLCGIGIESCVYKGVDFNKVLRNLANLTADLLIKYNLGINAIKQHYDFSSKNCPQVIREAKRWDEFIHLVKLELYRKTQLNDVIFSFKSLDPDVMDNFGAIINHPNKEKEISYQVTVNYEGKTEIFKYKTKIARLDYGFMEDKNEIY
ncbi:MAG: N-acetylmuramoyl-L-alanine amidase [Bacilli bacterium]